MTLHPGRMLGPYRLTEKIGEGGMGVVWKARDTSLDRDVALKLLPEALARDPERLARFEREAKAVAAVAHPGILAIHGFGREGDTAFAAMELLDGRTLREELRDGPLSPPRAIAIAREIAEGLAAAHERGIVHRDLKPENLFLTREGRVKILDFGLAAVVGPGAGDDDSRTPTRTNLTTPGVVLGTTNYLSPEQVRGETAGASSDLFSLGAVLWESLAGTRPFGRGSEAETLAAILRDAPPPLPRSVPRGLGRIVRRCLEKSPERRFASARELARELDALAAPSTGRRVVAIGAAVLVVAAVAVEVARRYAPPSAEAGGAATLTSIGEPRSASVEANEDFERGMLFLRSQLDLPRATQMLSRALEHDPDFPSARVMLGLTRLIAIHEGSSNDATTIYESERVSREVIEKHPRLASAHASLAAALLYTNRKEAAREELRRAMELNPRSQPGLAWLTIDARVSGREKEAEDGCRRMLEAVPLFWVARVILAESLFEGGDAGAARRELEKVLEQDPVNLSATRALARLEIHEGDLPAARARLERIDASSHPNHRVRTAWALLLAREGRAADAVAALDDEALKYAGVGVFAAWQAAEVYASAGRPFDALDWLDRGVRNGDERAGWLRRSAFFDSVRDQPRYDSILQSISRP